jgi:hypothetical protein
MLGENMIVKIGDFGLASKLEYAVQKRTFLLPNPF